MTRDHDDRAALDLDDRRRATDSLDSAGPTRRADDVAPEVQQALNQLTACVHEQARLAHERAQRNRVLAHRAAARAAAAATKAHHAHHRVCKLAKARPAPVKLHIVKKRSA